MRSITDTWKLAVNNFLIVCYIPFAESEIVIWSSSSIVDQLDLLSIIRKFVK